MEVSVTESFLSREPFLTRRIAISNEKLQCNFDSLTYPDPRKKFHFPVEAIKSTEVAEHKWGSHNSNFQFFEVELQLLGR